MEFREDIIRGIRLAGILFVALLLSLIGYRMLHATSSAAPLETKETVPVAAPVVEKAKTPDPIAVPAPPSAVAAKKSSTRKAKQVKKEIVASQPMPVIRNADPEPAPAPQTDDLPLSSAASNAPMANQLVEPAPQESAATPADTQQDKKAPRRGGLRAIGRFLHLGKQN